MIPPWKSKATQEFPEKQRLSHNRKVLDLISSGGGFFVIHPDSPEAKDMKLTSGDKILVDYQDRKNFSGGRVLKVIEKNKANFLPPEWSNRQYRISQAAHFSLPQRGI